MAPVSEVSVKSEPVQSEIGDKVTDDYGTKESPIDVSFNFNISVVVYDIPYVWC